LTQNKKLEVSMKRFKKLIVMLLVVSILAVSLSGCYGKFALTRKVYKMNGEVSNKYVRSLVMWVLMWIPVYSACGFIDFAILNLVEFWTGSNPLAMNDTDQEIKYYVENGQNIKVVTTQNRYDIYDLNDASKNVSFVFDAQNQNWMLEKDGKLITIVDENNQFTKFFDINGKLAKVEKM